ncbi:MAG TPA: DNA-3-methyladenine glycosylase [Patescibacteria group bacterium]
MWSAAEEFLLKDKYLRSLVTKWGACSIKAGIKKNYFIDLVSSICSQQLSGKAASTIFGRVEKLLGQITPENILKREDQELRDCGLSWAKIKYIKDLATKVKDGEVKINKLDKLTDEEVLTELVSVKGIGKWTAQMFLMFTLARPDIFPVDDLGIRNGFKKIIGKELKGEELAKFSERWKPYRTVASWYIWRSLENR